MQLDWLGLAVAVGLCVAVAALEGAITPDAVRTWYPTLNKPRWNLPFAAFVAVAIAVYVIDGFVAYRLWACATLPGSRTIGLTALVVVMVFNALWNCALFATRSTLVGWLGLLAFLAPLVVLQVALFVYDALAAWVHLVYFGWVVGYDLPLFYRIWRLNPPSDRHEIG